MKRVDEASDASARSRCRALPLGLGLDTIRGFTLLMQENKYCMVFARMTDPSKP
jgi:hypothetical protein